MAKSSVSSTSIPETPPLQHSSHQGLYLTQPLQHRSRRLYQRPLLPVVFDVDSDRGDVGNPSRISTVVILSPCKSAPYLWLETAVSLKIAGYAMHTKSFLSH